VLVACRYARPVMPAACGKARPSCSTDFDAIDAKRRVDEVAYDRRERPLVREQAEVSARSDDVGPAARSVAGRRYDRVVLPENREPVVLWWATLRSRVPTRQPSP
jgi:hypothetical protein